MDAQLHQSFTVHTRAFIRKNDPNTMNERFLNHINILLKPQNKNYGMSHTPETVPFHLPRGFTS